MDQCPVSCVICQTNKNCIECYPGFFLTQPNPLSVCVSVCPAGFFADTTTNSCLACHYSCQTCFGLAFNQCLTCNQSIFTYSPLRKTCECQENHFYSSSLGCQPCDVSCENCDNSTSCLSCKKGYFQTSSPLCSACLEECETCSSLLSCDSCSISKNRKLVATSSSVNSCQCIQSSFERSISAYFDSSLTRADYLTSDFGSCLSCPSGCLDCVNELKCTRCVLNDHRIFTNDMCYCQQLFKDDPVLRKCVSYDAEGIQQLQVTMTSIASASVVASLPILILGNPAFLISFVDIIQIIRYILYVDVRYPDIVVSFFKMFNVFDASFIPTLVEDNSYVLRTSNGFYFNEIDGLFLRNSNQYILVFIALAILYIITKILEKVILKPNLSITPEGANLQNKAIQSGPQIQKQVKNQTSSAGDQQGKTETNKNLNNQATSRKEKFKQYIEKAVGFFEWGIFLGCLEAAYLNITTFTFLQLQNASVSLGVEYISFFLSFIVLSVLIGFLITIYMIIQKALQIHEQSGILFLKESNTPAIISTSEEELKRIEEAKANDEFQKSFAMIYSLFVPGQILQQGYYLIVAARKFVFSLFLVFAYEVPGLILSVWILLNILMITILFKYRPYKNFIFTARDIVSEACFMIIHCLTYPFLSTDFVYSKSDYDDYQRLGRAIVAFSLIIIIIHLLCIIYESIMTIIEFFKPKEIIPPTPVIPATPSHTPMPKELIVLTEYQKLKIGLRKQKKFIKLQEIHKENFSQQINKQYFDRLQQLEDMMAQSNDDAEFEMLKKQYDLQVFLLNLSERLFVYVRENPSATIISEADLSSLSPVQLFNFKQMQGTTENQQKIIPNSEGYVNEQQNVPFEQVNQVQMDAKNQTTNTQQQLKNPALLNDNQVNQKLEQSYTNKNQPEANNAQQVENQINYPQKINNSAAGNNSQFINENTNAIVEVVNLINSDTQTANFVNLDQQQQVSRIQGDYSILRNQYSSSQPEMPIQESQINQISNQKNQSFVQTRNTQNQNLNIHYLKEITEQDDYMLYDQSINNQSAKYQQSLNGVNSPNKQQSAQQTPSQIVNKQSQVNDNQKTYKRKYQRQINPINASRVENINNALKQISYK